MKLDLVGIRHYLFIGSGIAVVLSLLVLAIPPALRPGIEFTSGTTTLIRFAGNVDTADLRAAYADLGHAEARIQSTGSREFLIRTDELDVPEGSFSEVAPEPGVDAAPPGPAAIEPIATLTIGAADATGDVLLRDPFNDDPCEFGDIAGSVPAGTVVEVFTAYPQCGAGDELVYEVAVGAVLGLVRAADTRDYALIEREDEPTVAQGQGERTVIEQELADRFGAFEVLEFATVSPVVSRVAVRNATVAVAVATLFIMGYVAFAFASVPSPFRYAASAIIALVHDVVIVVGAFSLLGKLFGMEVNLMFVTGLLTVIGFSVHDSIVVFDRIRENVHLSPESPLEDNVNAALIQTLARSLNTSLTVLLTVASLLFLGGETIREFLLVILIGVIAGTYSSIGVAAQALVAWERGDVRRWLRRSSAGQAPSATG